MSTERRPEIDLLDPDWHSNDPWPNYTYMREVEPVYWDSKNELWGIARYDDIIRISKNPKLFTSEEGNLPNMPPDPSLINQDGREHLVQRGLVSKAFTPKRIAAQEIHIRSIVTELINAVIEDGRCDFVESVAGLLPLYVIGDMIGIPRADQRKVLEWSDQMVKGGCGPDYITDAVTDAFDMFTDFHIDLAEERTRCPGEDIISVWMKAEIDGERLDETQVLFNHLLLFVGGTESTRSAISGGLEMLLRNPDQLAWALEDESRWPQVVEEVIRWMTPFIRMVRTATKDVEMHGTLIKEGDQVVMMYPAAARDPRNFEEADVFDVRKTRDVHAIAFGYGPHFCLGAPLARIETRIIYDEVFRRMKNLRFEPNREMTRTQSSFIRGPESMWLQYDPGPRESVCPVDHQEMKTCPQEQVG